ncbi:MAG: recA protein [Candidatus Moranbacteria bacterium GW2011_GWF2_34_56]|nr:MAG: recA protein [Candidatus Moranbacteria bacterium GW2011_GWF1_34_10]KKP64256.1 MAG: recA protein [Candidatus Moranbacteria bacterium GW2011_GWF2_34_56]
MATKSKPKELKAPSTDSMEKKLDVVVDEIRQKFGDGMIMKLGDVKKVDVASIPTGSISLDIALGIGGVPRGRIIEIYGPESSGKTTLSLHIAANAQKAGGAVAFVDAEHAMDPSYAKKIGVNIDELLISQPDSGEQALDIVETLVRSNAIDLIVVDSVAALVPRAEIEGEMGDHHVGRQARLMSQALRKLTPIMGKSNTVVIFINQIRMKIGVMFGNPETTSGGQALKFYSSVRIDVRRSAQIKSGEQVVGNRVKVKVVKNKVAPPFQTAEFDIMYNEGISRAGDLLDTGVRLEVIKKSGNSYSFGEEKLGTGREKAKAYLKENQKTFDTVAKEVTKAATAIKE